MLCKQETDNLGPDRFLRAETTTEVQTVGVFCGEGFFFLVSQFSNIEVIRKRCLTNKHALISPMHLNLEKLLVGSSRLVYESNLIHSSFLWFRGLIALFCSMFCFLQISTDCGVGAELWEGGELALASKMEWWRCSWALWMWGLYRLELSWLQAGELVSA